jgi:hypothetical protein
MQHRPRAYRAMFEYKTKIMFSTFPTSYRYYRKPPFGFYAFIVTLIVAISLIIIG